MNPNNGWKWDASPEDFNSQWLTPRPVDKVKDMVPFWLEGIEAAERGVTMKLEPFLEWLQDRNSMCQNRLPYAGPWCKHTYLKDKKDKSMNAPSVTGDWTLVQRNRSSPSREKNKWWTKMSRF
ncbi:hypothetical protein BDQ17DRAFT_1333913 [Cyathus striatus]|nr:hypothetical protein BDQ17DRAFT_1333913 [Cyathus striatus]